MGGAVCAKYLLCNPPAEARAENERTMVVARADCKANLKKSKVRGLTDLGRAIEGGLILNGEQMQLFHAASAVLDQPIVFEKAFDALRESLIDASVKG